MVKCSRCGLEIMGEQNICPNCGNDLTDLEESSPQSDGNNICNNCGAPLKEDAAFCDKCGNKIASADEVPKCEGCGSEIPENVLFCPTCGAKVKQKPRAINGICPNCGFELEKDIAFCPDCGSNVFTDEKTNAVIQSTISGNGFLDKINLNVIMVPTIISVIASIILSLIGLLIDFSWFSFILAIIISVGFFAGTINNEANAVISGLITGLILGLLENPLVEFLYGAFVSGVYEGYFGGHLLILVLLGIICAYISNVFLKSNIQGIVEKLGISWL